MATALKFERYSDGTVRSKISLTFHVVMEDLLIAAFNCLTNRRAVNTLESSVEDWPRLTKSEIVKEVRRSMLEYGNDQQARGSDALYMTEWCEDQEEGEAYLYDEVSRLFPELRRLRYKEGA